VDIEPMPPEAALFILGDGEMPDEKQDQGEMPEEEKKVEMTQDVEPQEEEFDKERAMATITKLREFEKEARMLKKKLDAYEKAEQERKEAEMSEMEKLKAQYDKAQAELSRIQKNQQKREIAQKVGLPEALALRIQGDDEEAMEADAKKLAEALPKPEVKKVMSPTQPGVGAQQGETYEQKRARILGTGADVFDEAWIKAHGGGVSVPVSSEE